MEFLRKYDRKSANAHDAIINDILNTNFSEEEIRYAINYPKNNKSPGIDGIPAELIKACKEILSPDITMMLNYIIERCEFPANWTIGIRSAVHKSGTKSIVDNCRGITILPVMEKNI